MDANSWMIIIGVLVLGLILIRWARQVFWKVFGGVLSLLMVLVMGYRIYHTTQQLTETAKDAQSLVTHTIDAGGKVSQTLDQWTQKTKDTTNDVFGKIDQWKRQWGQLTGKVKPQEDESSYLENLLEWTNAQSPGPSLNYVEDIPALAFNADDYPEIGKVRASSDAYGRSSVAEAVLTYEDFKESQGSRQGTPLDPPDWPKNFKASITFQKNQSTYNGYFYNRSHSIADSLMGKASYASKYNFTTGTRSQNVGTPDHKGGMRAPEIEVETYWRNHPDTLVKIYYRVTPLYYEKETLPRGSVVTAIANDGSLHKSWLVINSAEGYEIDYETGRARKK